MGEVTRCVACSAVLSRPGHAKRQLTHAAVAAAASLVLFPPAVLLPTTHVEHTNALNPMSMLSCTIESIRAGRWVAGVAAMLLILLPLAKCAIMLCEIGPAMKVGRVSPGLRNMVVTGHSLRPMDAPVFVFLMLALESDPTCGFCAEPALIVYALCVVLCIYAAHALRGAARSRE